MTLYEAEYHGTEPSIQPGTHRVVLAEHATFIEMKIHPHLRQKTRHSTVESLLNTWRNIRPVRINSKTV